MEEIYKEKVMAIKKLFTEMIAAVDGYASRDDLEAFFATLGDETVVRLLWSLSNLEREMYSVIKDHD